MALQGDHGWETFFQSNGTRNGGRIDFFLLKWDHYFIFGFLWMIKPDSDRISTLEPFMV